MAKRHRWAKLAIHNYLCIQCGMLKVNSQTGDGEWQATFHRPNGTQGIERHVPPCEPGVHTQTRLKLYADHQAKQEAANGETGSGDRG